MSRLLLALVLFSRLAWANPEPDVPVHCHFDKDGSVTVRIEIDPRCFTDDPMSERYLMKVDLTWQPIQKDDVLVLCSDGLSGQVKREEIGQLATETPDLMELCSKLVEMANERGGPDNITCVVFEIVSRP